MSKIQRSGYLGEQDCAHPQPSSIDSLRAATDLAELHIQLSKMKPGPLLQLNPFIR